jgi:choline monooxygenase
MSRLTSAEQQLQAELLQQLEDGRLDKPTAEGSALPNLAYTSADFFALEQQTVFRNNWVFAGFAHDFREVGDMRPVEIAGQPVVLAMSAPGVIRAFHNACRHRGAKLVTECGRHGKFVCANHSWSYGLDGRLIARPHFYGGEQHDVNRETCHRANLVEIRSVTWHDWIFIDLGGMAGKFESLIAPIEKRLEGYDLDALGFGGSLEFDLEANWKLAIENFIEPYHVFSCHPWLDGFVGMGERSAPVFDGKILSCGYRFRQADPARGGALPWFPGLPDDKRDRGDWFVLFPNFAFEIFPDQVDVFVVSPRAPRSSRETIALYFVGDGADADEYQAAREHVIHNWTDLNHEDIGIIERMQAGRYSEGFDGGVLSPYWDPVQQHFARLMVESIAGQETSSSR